MNEEQQVQIVDKLFSMGVSEQDLAQELGSLSAEEQTQWFVDMSKELGFSQKSPDERVDAREAKLIQESQDIQEQGIDPRAENTQMLQEMDPEQELSQSAAGQTLSGAVRAADNALFGLPSKIGSAIGAVGEAYIEKAKAYIEGRDDQSFADHLIENYKENEDLTRNFQEQTMQAKPLLQSAIGLGGYAIQGYGIAKSLGTVTGGFLKQGIAAAAESTIFDGIRNVVDTANEAFVNDSFDAKQVLKKAAQQTKTEATTAGVVAGGLSLVGGGLARAVPKALAKAGQYMPDFIASKSKKVLAENPQVWKGFKNTDEASTALKTVKKEIFNATREIADTFETRLKGAASDNKMLVADAMEKAGTLLDNSLTDFIEVAQKDASGPEVAKAVNNILSVADGISDEVYRNYGRELDDLAQYADSKGTIDLSPVIDAFYDKLQKAGAGVFEDGKFKLLRGGKETKEFFEQTLEAVRGGANFTETKNLTSTIGAMAKWGQEGLSGSDKATIELWEDLTKTMKNQLQDPDQIVRFETMQSSYRDILEGIGAAKSVKKKVAQSLDGDKILKSTLGDEAKEMLMEEYASDLGKQVGAAKKLNLALNKAQLNKNTLIQFSDNEVRALNSNIKTLKLAFNKAKMPVKGEKIAQWLGQGKDTKAVQELEKIYGSNQAYIELKRQAQEFVGLKNLKELVMDPGNKKLLKDTLSTLPPKNRKAFSELLDTVSAAQRMQGIDKGLLKKVDYLEETMPELGAEMRLALQGSKELQNLLKREEVIKAFIKTNPKSIGRLFNVGRSALDEIAVGAAGFAVLGHPGSLGALALYQGLKEPATMQWLADSKFLNLDKLEKVSRMIRIAARVSGQQAETQEQQEKLGNNQ